MGGAYFTDFKSSNRIEISWLDQVLSNFNWFGGPLWGVVDGWMGVGLCKGVWGVPHAHAHVHMHACTCTCEQWCHNGNSLGKPITREQPFAWNYHVYTCMHVCMHACVCTHVHRVPPNTLTESHPHPSTPTPPRGDTWNQSKVNKNWTNRDIWILFEDFGSLNTCALI